jgi:tRNA-binding protein
MNPLEAFQTLDLRVGRITRVELHDKARKPAYKLWIDFGDQLGEKTSSAQLTELYQPDDLENRLVIAAVNLGTRTIGGFKAEALFLGLPVQHGRVVLLQPERDVPLGGRVY